MNNSKPTLEEDEQPNADFMDETPKDHPVKNSTQIPKENQPKLFLKMKVTRDRNQTLFLLKIMLMRMTVLGKRVSY